MSQNPEIQRATRLSQHLALGLLLSLYLAVALAHACLAPLTTGPDELAHYDYVNFIDGQRRLPMNNTERAQAGYKSDQPPLYHVIAALPAALVDITGPPFLKRVNDHPRRQLIERNRHAWGLYNTEDEQWPYRGQVLRWHVGRWVAILFGAATVAVTFWMARDLFERLRPGQAAQTFGSKAWLPAFGAAAIVAFIPRFALTGAMLNYETTLALLTTLFLWTLLRIVNKQAPNTGTVDQHNLSPTTHYALHPRAKPPYGPHYSLLLGLLAGLAITAKLSALILPLEIAIALWLIGRSKGWPWPQRLRGILVATLATLVTISWWFGFTLYHFNTVAKDGWWAGLLRPLIAADASDATTNRLLSLLTAGQAGFTGALDNLDTGPPWQWLAIFFQTFWRVEIEEQEPLGLVGLLIVLGFCLLAAWGLWLAWRHNEPQATSPHQKAEGISPLWQAEVGEATFPLMEAGETSSHWEAEGAPTPYTQRQRRLLLSLLLLHLLLPLILPFARYAATFSLADTAQGRHLLFMAAPALAILLVWGLSTAAHLFSTHPSSFILHHSPFIIHHFFLLLPLFLLLWSGVQLWTMTWAYIPPLPVRTLPLPAAERQITAVVEDRRLNEFMTLIGYQSRLDPAKGLLRVDLWWQALAVSPTDYLTEITLLDAGGQVRSQWLGYSASGRYPTRAWDVGDTIRDTTWLPIAGLAPGRYRLRLSLMPTSLHPSLVGAEPTSPVLSRLEDPILPALGKAAESQAEGIELDVITLADRVEPVFVHSLPQPVPGHYTVWQNGQALTQPQTFRYRETILITLSPPAPGQTRQLTILPPCSPAPLIPCSPYPPIRQSESQALFIVGPDWPAGLYQLQASLAASNQTQQQVQTPHLFQVIDLWQRQFIEPPIANRLEANFANQVKLLGYELGTNRAEPGGGIPITLYWQGLDWLGEDYTIFTKLLAADQTVQGGRERLPREGYRTLYWAPGEIVTDSFGVPVAAAAPAGIYYLNVGLYKVLNGQAYSLSLVQDGQVLETSSINIGPIKIGAAPPGLTLDQINPQAPLNQLFGDAPHLTLLGYDLTDEHNQPIQVEGSVRENRLDSSGLAKSPGQLRVSKIENLKLRLYWRSEAILPTDYTTFVHLRNPAGDTVAQKDQPPLNGAYPTSLWDPGQIIADEIIIPLPPELSGSYELIVGMYDFKSGVRLTVPHQPDNSLSLSRLELP